MRKLLFLAVTLAFLTGCPSDNPAIPQPVNPEDFKPGTINAELEAALNTALYSTQQKAIPAPCPAVLLEELSEEQTKAFECGAIQVPEFHDQSTGSFQALAYLKVAKNPSQKKPLLIIEQGGPGSSSMMLAAYYIKAVPELLNDFDILAVEQRGTKWTRPLAVCNDVIDFNLKSLNQIYNPLDEKSVQKNCLDEVSQRINLNSISTYQIASDLDWSAKHFGYQKYSYFGVSYGTLVGHYLLEYFPDSLERTVLDSPVIPGKDWTHNAVSNMDSLVKKNIKSFISSEKSWNKTYEETLEYINRLSLVFDRFPLQVTYTYENKEYPLWFTGKHFNSLLVSTLVKSYDPSLFSYFIQAAEKRMTDEAWSKKVLGLIASAYEDAEDGLTTIMYQALICREFDVDESQVGEIISGWTEIKKLFNSEEFEQLSEGAGESRCYFGFTKRNDSKVIKGIISTDESVLVVGGEIDHVTIPAYVAAVSKNFSNGHQAVFKDTGHGAFGRKDCINKSIIGYLKDSENRFINFCKD